MNILKANPHHTALVPLAGSPICQSVAVFLYNHLCDLYGINAFFFPLNISKEDFPDFYHSCKLFGFRGAILTSPLKGLAAGYVDETDSLSEQFRSINCIRFDNGKATGHGYDGKGMISSLDLAGADLSGKEIVILGGGGVAGIFAGEIASRGIKKIVILNRSPEKAKSLAQKLQHNFSVDAAYGTLNKENAVKFSRTADVLLQATTLGMKGQKNYKDLGFIDCLPEHCRVLEAISNPLETELVKRAKNRGLQTISGIHMMINQVEIIFRFLFDVTVDAKGKESAYTFYYKLLGGEERQD